MSDNDNEDSDTQILTAEYRDGRLQIVSAINGEGTSEDIPADAQRFIQVLDPEKGLVNLDSLNLTLVRCEGSEGDSSYRLVTNAECEGDGDASVTCMLQDDLDDDVSYVVVEGDEDQLIILENDSNDHNDQHGHNEQHDTPSDPQMFIDIEIPNDDSNQGSIGNVVQSDQQNNSDQHGYEVSITPWTVSPEELIQRAKIVQQRLLEQQRHRLAKSRPPQKQRGPKRHITSPQDILVASPGFKLFLYSCKLCSYKCNAQKELTKHRNTAHVNKARVNRSLGFFQCAKCPYRAGLPQQLTTHMEEKHHSDGKITIGKMLTLDSKEVFEADVLVCGACGFECSDRGDFRDHIANQHM